MELTGKLISFLHPQEGESSKGKWIKQEIIINTLEQFPKNVVIAFWGEMAKTIQNVKPNTELTAHINIESREYNGRWYTEVKAWKVDVKGAKPAEAKPSETSAPEPIGDDDLNTPF